MFIQLTNAFDLACFRRGSLRPEQVRRIHTEAEIVLGGYPLSIPQNLLEMLGLECVHALQTEAVELHCGSIALTLGASPLEPGPLVQISQGLADYLTGKIPTQIIKKQTNTI